jgi:DNA-directed RNA polymerase specialized sigma24 family protein
LRNKAPSGRPVPEQRHVKPEEDMHADDILRLIPALRAGARRLCDDDADADALVEETLSWAIAHADTVRADTDLIRWLSGIMDRIWTETGCPDAGTESGTAAPILH